MKTTDTIRTDRRGFFKRLAGVGIAGAGALVLARADASEREPETSVAPAPAQAKGYQETEHVRRYYETARF